jgi:hypothetical protein
MDWCAWCQNPVETPTIVRGVPFHWSCLKLRMVALRLLAAEERQCSYAPGQRCGAPARGMTGRGSISRRSTVLHALGTRDQSGTSPDTEQVRERRGRGSGHPRTRRREGMEVGDAAALSAADCSARAQCRKSGQRAGARCRRCSPRWAQAPAPLELCGGESFAAWKGLDDLVARGLRTPVLAIIDARARASPSP